MSGRFVNSLRVRLLPVLAAMALAACGAEDGTTTSGPATSAPPSSGSPSTPTTTNSAPTIVGSPTANVVAGSAYGFTPTANDANGNTLSFSVQNKPAWASFNISNGTLSGTPTAGDVGTYSNIVISVSDGMATTALASFSVNVTQIGVGTAILSWSVPTQNTDGSALVDLAGYRVYYGNNPNAMAQSININTVGMTTYVVTNLGSGTWYFAIKSVNSVGVESDMSNVASKTIS